MSLMWSLALLNSQVDALPVGEHHCIAAFTKPFLLWLGCGHYMRERQIAIQSPSSVKGLAVPCAKFTWNICSHMVFSSLSHTHMHFWKRGLLFNDTAFLGCVHFFYIFSNEYYKQKCLISSKLTLPFNHNGFHPWMDSILAAIYCFGTVSNCSGKLLLALLIKVTKINRQDLSTYSTSLSRTDFT